MLQKVLLDQEIILAQEIVTRRSGLITAQFKLIITNHQILFLPLKSWRTVFGVYQSSIIWDDIINISLTNLNLSLEIESKYETVSLVGSSLSRIFSVLQFYKSQKVSLDTAIDDLFKKQMVYSGETQLLVRLGISQSASLHIFRDYCIIETISSMRKRTYTIVWDTIIGLEFASLNQMLTIKTPQSTISILGTQAVLLHYLLEIMSQGERSFDTISLVTLMSGRLSSEGYLFLGTEYIHFVPCGIFSTAIGFEPMKLPLTYIQYFKSDPIQIGFKNSKGKEWLWEFSSANDVLWSTYSKRSLLRLFQVLKTKSLPKICWLDTNKNTIWFGNLQYTKKEISFHPQNEGALFSLKHSQIFELSVRSNRLHIQTEQTQYIFETLFKGLSEQWGQRLEEHKAVNSPSFQRGNQPIANILGKSSTLSVFSEGVTVAKLYGAHLRQRENSIQINSEKEKQVIHTPKNALLEIEILNHNGHFKIQTQLLENHLNVSGLNGMYYLNIAEPLDVVLLNQRHAFRVPTQEEIEVTLHLEDNKDIQVPALLLDLSIGGCRLQFNGISPREAQNVSSKISETIFDNMTSISFSLPFHINYSDIITLDANGKEVIKEPDQRIELHGESRRCFFQHEYEQMFVGLQFDFNLSPRQTEHLLLQKILQIERETIRLQKSKDENDDDDIQEHFK